MTNQNQIEALCGTMLAALLSAEVAVEQLCQGQDPANQCWATLKEIRAAIVAAGEPLPLPLSTLPAA